MLAKIIKDSISNGVRISTYILEYPRFIHSEFMTHRVFSRNAASSRAIPTKDIIRNIRENPAEAVWWGKAMGGMQAKEQLTGWKLNLAKGIWATARNAAILLAWAFHWLGLHKQLANRILEPFQNIRVVVTSTEWNNFFALRNHPDAQPEFKILAELLWYEQQQSTPIELKPGQWHIPYVETLNHVNGDVIYINPRIKEGNVIIEQLTLEQALMVSASMAAQESYRKSDNSLEKASSIYSRLIDSQPVHASPVEHQAQAMDFTSALELPIGYGPATTFMRGNPGITHIDRNGNFWSGNFRGWIQNRQTIPNHHIPG